MKRVLIVDDHEIIRRGIKSLLANSPYTVCGEAGDGLEAIDRVTELTPDLVLLDISMPRMTGIETLRRIRLIAPATKVILFTMHSPESVRSAGADAVVSKQASSTSLIATMEQVLGDSTSPPASAAPDSPVS